VPATIVMPRRAPLAKVQATRGYGAEVVLFGDAFDEAHAEALRIAEARDLAYVHPFDDPTTMAGQGTVALEMLEDVPDLDTLVVPIGGGGLIAGIAVAAKQLKPGIRIIGVQAKGANSTFLAYHGRYEGPLDHIATIADGLATRAPGEHTLPIIKRYVDDVVEVEEDAIAQTVVMLMERAKVVAEPAGAVALAALLGRVVPSPGKSVGVVVSGGNIDMNMMDRILQFGFNAAGRLLQVRTQLIDRPGQLLMLSQLLTDADANIFEIVHHRLGSSRSVNEVDLDLTLEVRDREHGDQVLAKMREMGYSTEVIIRSGEQRAFGHLYEES
jgi:threonine dehydratase